LGVIFFLIFPLSGCGKEYPLIANGYSQAAELSALDSRGLGNFALPVPPKGCLLAFSAMPDLATMQIRVVIGKEVDRTYDSAALARALDQEDFSGGVFLVDESGVRFAKDYDCDSEVR
jgi:hypothetical protein